MKKPFCNRLIRLFFGTGKSKNICIDGGHIELRVKFVDEDSVIGGVVVELQKELTLSTRE